MPKTRLVYFFSISLSDSGTFIYILSIIEALSVLSFDAIICEVVYLIVYID